MTRAPPYRAATMRIEFGSRIRYLAGRDSVLLSASVDGRPVPVLMSYDALARRFRAAGASREHSARLAVLANRPAIAGLVRARLAGDLPPGGELTID
jgi:Protein of unknown function (DUF1488)